MAKKSAQSGAKARKKQQRQVVRPQPSTIARPTGDAIASPPAASEVLARASAVSATRLAQRSQASRAAARPTATLPTDYEYVKTDVRRLGMLAVAATVTLVALSFIIPMVIR
jgi:hypothetical protein